jgi:hypothetical protein
VRTAIGHGHVSQLSDTVNLPANYFSILGLARFSKVLISSIFRIVGRGTALPLHGLRSLRVLDRLTQTLWLKFLPL